MFGNIKIQLAFRVEPIYFFVETPVSKKQLSYFSCLPTRIIHLGTVRVNSAIIITIVLKPGVDPGPSRPGQTRLRPEFIFYIYIHDRNDVVLAFYN